MTGNTLPLLHLFYIREYFKELVFDELRNKFSAQRIYTFFSGICLFFNLNHLYIATNSYINTLI